MVPSEHLHDGQGFKALPTALETCPTCDQPLPLERTAEVKGRLAARERQLAADVTARLNTQFERERTAVREHARQEATATLNTRLAEQAQRFEDVIGDLRTQAAASDEKHTQAVAALDAQRADSVQREATARESARQEAAVTLSERLQEQAQGFEQAIGTLRDQLAAAEESRLHLSQAHAEALSESDDRYKETTAAQQQEISDLKAKLADASNSTQAQVDAARREYQGREQATVAHLQELTDRLAAAEAQRAAVAEQLQLTKEGRATDIARAVQETREALEKDKTAAVHAEQAKRLDETQKLSEQLKDLQRKLERKTAEELGEGAELDLHEELKARFDGDLIRRVPHGVAGADIIHEIRENGVVCGKIVYDSKNRKDWKYEYASKLRADQIAEHADHAILATNKFPAGAKHLHMHEHVIIACPARVLAVAEIMREQVVQFHTLRVSNEAREEKTQQLYEFMTSPRAAQLFDAVDTQITKLEEIDTAEVRAHQIVWDRRGKTVKSLEKAHGNLRFEVQRIVGALNSVEGE